MLDVLIRGGRLIDGTGSPWTRADIGIANGRIVAVGVLDSESAARTIDASGLYVCPGFVDMHTHSDLQLLGNPEWSVKLAQGVTLEVLGQDGLGLAPIDAQTGAILREQLRGWNGEVPGLDWDWRSVAEYLDRFDATRVAPNVCVLVPHGTLRIRVMGLDNRAPTPGELGIMQALVEAGMRDGAVGLSGGLTYAPAVYSDDDEIVELCRVLRPFGGYWQPHHRNYSAGAMHAYAASIDIGRRSGVPVHLTHANLSQPVNRGRAGELLAMIDAARNEGVDVTLDTYPYLAGNTYLHAALPAWVHEGGNAAILARLADSDTRERIRRDLEEPADTSTSVPVDWSTILVTGASRPENKSYVGKSIAEAARSAAGSPAPFDVFCDLVVSERLSVAAITFTGNEENVRAIMQHPAHMAGSDGIVVGDRPHPRAWGTFARYLGVYVRELRLVRLEDMVRKMTSLPAQRLGFYDRGVVRPGAAADVVCFDAERVRDTATYEDPRRLPEGVPYVLVNGSIVIDNGHHTGARPGRALRKQTSSR